MLVAADPYGACLTSPVQVIMMPRPAGWGIKSANLLSELCGLAGIKDISIKVSWSGPNEMVQGP
jgi:ribosomal protein S5